MRIGRTGWLAAVLALTLAPPALRAAPADGAHEASERVKMGVDAWQAGNFASALTIWRPLAEAGNADAQFNVAQAYRLGRGVAADPKQAMAWYRKAAEQEHPQAAATYGLMLYQGGDKQGAMPWLQKAADRGDPRALYVVATAQFNGDPLPKDWIGAYARMTRAAASGLPQAKTSLAEMEGLIPADQRAKGTEMAARMEHTTSATPLATPAASPAPPPARPAPTAIRTTELPPSRPAPLPSVAPPPIVAAAAAPAPSAYVAVAPSPKQAGADRWRVQFGAFANAGKAQQAWGGITRRVAALGDARPFYVEAGAITRLQAGPFADRAAATRLCAASKAAGQDCFVTAAP
jgi:cell division protein FtsN